MNQFARFVLFTLLLLVCVAPIAAQGQSPLVQEMPADSLVEWMELLRDRVRFDTLNPARGARVYGYAGVTAFEALYPGMPDYRSMVFQINGLRDLPFPDPDQVFDWQSSMDAAMRDVLTHLFAPHSADSRAAFAELYARHRQARVEAVGEEVVARSADFGEELASALIVWIDADRASRAAEERLTYVLPTAASLGLTSEHDYVYVPTSPDLPIIEPRWGVVRTLTAPDRYQCIIRDNMPFSLDEDSAYRQQAIEVFETVNNLTREQQEIARYWHDTPGDSSTPAGHWVSIATHVIRQQGLTLDRAAMVYGMLGLVLHDAFVVGFGIKYEGLTMRPETYIQRHISPRWRPYLETPMFPEYPSNHALVSAAAADILTSILGIVPFTDTTSQELHGLVRRYHSFEQAADESGISRLYGGIHYRTAIENGRRIGRCIATRALERIKLLPIAQGG